MPGADHTYHTYTTVIPNEDESSSPCSQPARPWFSRSAPACKRWSNEPIMLRQGARVVHDRKTWLA